MTELPFYNEQILNGEILELLESYRDNPKRIIASDPPKYDAEYRNSLTLYEKDIADSLPRLITSLHQKINEIRDDQYSLLRKQSGLAYCIWNALNSDDAVIQNWAIKTLETAREVEEKRRPETLSILSDGYEED